MGEEAHTPVSLLQTATRSPVWLCPEKGLAIVIAAVVALGGCTRPSTPTGPTPRTGQTSTTADHTYTPPPQTTQTTVAPPPPVGMNEEARDGTFGFTVISSHVATVQGGRNDEKTYPQGVFVWIVMWVKNIGSTISQRYFADYQRLLDSEGRVFSPDLDTMSQMPQEFYVSRRDINPGNQSKVVLVFDVPKGTQPSDYLLLLHSSPDSGGVTVRLQ